MLIIVKHPLIAHKLGRIRDFGTQTAEFRELVKGVGALLCYEATKTLKLDSEEVCTWTKEKLKVETLSRHVVLVPIWRAGGFFSRGIEGLLPFASINPLGLCRDEESLEPRVYYEKWSQNLAQSTALVLDPMLATAGSMSFALSRLKAARCKDIRVIGLIASLEAKKRLEAEHPDVPVFVAAIDKKLDSKGRILPGLGDAGDRLFGTG
jgi:uracil phosphoribosyltransferase